MKYLVNVLLLLLIIPCQAEKQPGINPFPNFDSMWDYQNPKETEKKFKEILPMLKDSPESTYDAGYHAELLTQIARTQGMQGKFEEAHKTLDQVYSMLTANLKTAKIRYLLERGRVYNSSGNSLKSRTFFLEAWNFVMDNLLDIYAIDAAHMMGIVEVPEKQLEWSLKALEVTERTDDKRAKGWLGSLYNNIGWTYHDSGEYEQALELFQKGLEWRKTRNNEQATRIAKWNVGRCLRSLKKNDEALQIQNELLQEFEEKQIEQDGYVFEELAELYLIKNNQSEAKKYFKLAYEYLSKDEWLEANEPDRIKRLKKLGE
ncbi:MAG: tetratricopeptide repeat protein [Candidatus Cloacimonetes bacterium]|nr:tetratricopeptide repeat protein [Candidatus Cloacimonadota bacterium]